LVTSKYSGGGAVPDMKRIKTRKHKIGTGRSRAIWALKTPPAQEVFHINSISNQKYSVYQQEVNKAYKKVCEEGGGSVVLPNQF